MFKHIRAKALLILIAVVLIEVSTNEPAQAAPQVPPTIVPQKSISASNPSARPSSVPPPSVPPPSVPASSVTNTPPPIQHAKESPPPPHAQTSATPVKPVEAVPPVAHSESSSATPVKPVEAVPPVAHSESSPPPQQQSQVHSPAATQTSPPSPPKYPEPAEIKAEHQGSTIPVDHQGPTIPIEPYVPDSSQYNFQSSVPSQAGKQIQLEQEQAKEELKEEEHELHPWIAQEIRQFEQQAKDIISQSFNFVLHEGDETLFKWNPSKSKQLKLSVQVYEVNSKGEISLIRQGEQDEYLEVFLRNQGKSVFTHLGNVYINKVFTVLFDTDYKYLRFVNKNSFMIALTIDVQSPETVLPNSVVKDQHFSMPAQKLTTIHRQMVSGEISRQHHYKYEWGFQEKQLAHDSRLLGLTGVELFIILATGIVQMYFVKSLLDNRAVV